MNQTKYDLTKTYFLIGRRLRSSHRCHPGPCQYGWIPRRLRDRVLEAASAGTERRHLGWFIHDFILRLRIVQSVPSTSDLCQPQLETASTAWTGIDQPVRVSTLNAEAKRAKWGTSADPHQCRYSDQGDCHDPWYSGTLPPFRVKHFWTHDGVHDPEQDTSAPGKQDYVHQHWHVAKRL